jgi:hypothetical protein
MPAAARVARRQELGRRQEPAPMALSAAAAVRTLRLPYDARGRQQVLAPGNALHNGWRAKMEGRSRRR